METKILDKTEQFIADRLKTNSAAVDETSASVEAAQANKEKAEKKSEKALNNGNVDEYQKAHDAIKKAEATIFVHSSLLNKLKTEPIISPSEYESKVSDVLAELEGIVNKHREKVVALIDQIADIANEDAEIIQRGNAILKQLQHDLYRDADCTRTDKYGHKQHDSYKEKRYKDNDVKGLSDQLLNDPKYKKFGGTRKSNGNAPNMAAVMAYHMQHVTYHNK